MWWWQVRQRVGEGTKEGQVSWEGGWQCCPPMAGIVVVYRVPGKVQEENGNNKAHSRETEHGTTGRGTVFHNGAQSWHCQREGHGRLGRRAYMVGKAKAWG